MVCSWDAEEYGLMGSKEWVEVTQYITVTFIMKLYTSKQGCISKIGYERM